MFIAIILALMMLISSSFAMNNDTSILNEESSETEVMSVSSLESDTLKASNDYYFNASAENDGDGSLKNPFKYLTNERIRANSNIYLADGDYKLDSTKIINQVNIYGSNTNKTIITYLGTGFNVMGSLSVNNVTLKDMSIINNGKLKVKNTVFDGGVASSIDSYGNNFGGAVYTPSEYPGATVEIENTVFNGTYAEYGGAIYMGQGVLNITNSLFYDIYSYSFGGAIACEFNVKIRMNNVKILKCKSLNDAGGAIYLKESSLTADNLNITDCESTFGGAITALSSDVSLNYFNANNNIAKYNGGAIYHIYGSLNSNYGRFYNNSASNGGAIFMDNVTSLFLLRNNFINNKANHTAGAIYSLLSNPSRPFMAFNSFYSNTAKYNKDCYELSSVNLTIGDGNYTMYNNQASPVNNIPAYYNLASRDLSTSVKDQQSSGTCWSFSALAALESCILKASGEHLDLSEEHMKNIMTLYSDYGWAMDNDDGGYDSMPMAYLTSWLGPVLESDDPFDDHSALSPLLKSIMHVQNIIFLKRDSPTDNNAFKEAILKYGALSTSIYMDTYYLNYNTNAYWSWAEIPCNHAVTIVGWDDNYDKSNFKFAGSLKGNGAWIVKNSWGTDWGDKGYFYVSYYDAKFAQPGVENTAYTFILNDTIKYDKNYQYDIGGKTDYFRNGDENVWYKNIFTSTEHEYMTAVSTYFEKITDWALTVKVNDIVKITKTGKYNPGYYTIDLGEFLELNKNDVFEIIFNIDTGLDVAGVPVSEKASLTKELYKPETSYISYNGINWIDLYNLTGSYGLSTYSSQVACIKAFTITNELNATVFTDTYYENDKLVKITANSVDQYGNKITKGNITININGINYTCEITDGKATLNNPVLNQSLTNVTVTLVSTGYKKSENKTAVTAPKTKISLNMDIKTISNNATITLKTNNYTGKLSIKINNDDYTVVFKDNEAVLNLTLLENNKYDVKVIPEELSLYEFDPLTDSFTIDFRKTDILSDNMITVENSNELFNITLIDEKGEKVIGKEIIFTIGSLNYTNTTNSNGTASIPVDLTGGEYEIKIRYDGDKEYTSAQTLNTIKVKISLTINIDADVKSNNATLTVTASKPVNETLTVNINTNRTTVKLNNGKTSINLYNLTNGEYTVNISMNNDDYLVDTADTVFTVDVKSTHIVSDNLVMLDDETVLFNIALLDENNSPVAGREIIFSLNDEQVITDGDGRALVPLTLANGEYLINIQFKGDDDYFASESSNNVTVKTAFDIDLNAERVLNNVAVNVVLSKDLNVTLTVEINGVESEVLVQNGKAVIDFSDLANGNYTVKAGLNDKKYIVEDVTANFTVNVKSTHIISSDMIMLDDETAIFNITLIDEDDSPVVGREIIFSLNDEPVITDGDGKALVPLTLANGEYLINIQFKGDNDYFASESTNNVTVKTAFDIDLNAERVLNNVAVNVVLSKDLNVTLTVEFDGVESEVLVQNGKAVIDLSGLANGDYTVKAGLNDDKYVTEDVTANFTVNVKSTHIISSDMIMLDDETVLFNITLIDEDDSPVAGREIIFSLIDELVITGGDGRALVPLTLANGEYLINIQFKGDNDYFASESTNNVTVKTAFDIDLNAERVLNNVTVNVVLSKDLNVTLTVEVNGVESEVVVKNGKAVIDFSGLANGDYTVKAGLNDDKYVTGEVSFNFTVNIKKTIIISNDIEAFENEEILFNITLTDEDNNPLTGKNITFQLNKNIYASGITDEKGIISIPIKLNSGECTIESIFGGDNNYIKTITSNNIKISIQNTTDNNNTEINGTGDNNNTDFNGNNTSINGTGDNNTDFNGNNTENIGDNNTDFNGNNTDINITDDVIIALEIIKNRNNVLINIGLSKELNETLKATVNNKTYSVNIIDGKGVLELNDLQNNDYEVTVEYDGKYNSTKFTVDIKQSKIIAEDLIIFNQNSIKYNITLLGEDNTPLKGKTVRFNIENKEYISITDDNGQTTLDISLINGNHKITINFDGDENYFKSEASANIAVKTNVTIDLNIKQESNNAVININLSETINATLSVTVNGKTQNIKINSNSADLTLSKLNAGLYDVQVSIVENDLYDAEKAVKQFTINVKDTAIHSNDLITYYCSNDEFTVTLTDIDGYFLEDKVIIFKIGDNTHFRKTDSKGLASININLTDNVYELTVLFKGDDNYRSSYANNKITVKSTIIPEDNLTKTLNSNYGFKLLNANGEALANTKITFKFNNIKYDAVSDVNGNVNVEISEKPGSYKLIIENPVTGENLIKTVNIVERIAENNDMVIYAFSGTEYKVLILDDNGNNVKAGEIVTFKINGKTVNAKTDSNAYASLKISLKAKKYTVTAEYKGYKVSNKITVKPVLTAKNISKKKAKSYKFQAKLVNTKGKALKGKKITFKIKGKKYTAKTNKKGVATVTIKLSLKVGSYKITSTYGKSKITNTLKIKK